MAEMGLIQVTPTPTLRLTFYPPPPSENSAVTHSFLCLKCAKDLPSAEVFHLVFPLPGKRVPFHGSASTAKSSSVHPCSRNLPTCSAQNPATLHHLSGLPLFPALLSLLFFVLVLSGKISIAFTRMSASWAHISIPKAWHSVWYTTGTLIRQLLNKLVNEWMNERGFQFRFI